MALAGFLPGSRIGRRMVGLAFLSQNCAVGMVLGSYGALIPSIEADFGATRALSSLGLALVALMMGLLSPIVGMSLRKVSVRAILTSGAAITALGYLLLSVAGNIITVLIIFAAFIGTGTAMMAVVAPATLISRWYHEGRGKAFGLINMPVLVMLVPPIAAEIVTSWGLTIWFLCVASIFVLICPLMLFVVDEPEQIGEQAHGAAAPAGRPAGGAVGQPTPIRVTALVASPQFWLLTLGVGLSTGAGNAFMTHIVPYASTRSFTLQSGSLLLTAYGAAGLIGNLALGWLADRIGPSLMLGISAMGQALLWTALLFVSGFPMLIGIAALLGFFTTSIIALHGAAVNELFGPRNVSSVMGFGYFAKLPFMFGAVPLAGYLYDITGRYDLPFSVFSVGMFCAALGFFTLAVLNVRSKTRTASAMPETRKCAIR